MSLKLYFSAFVTTVSTGLVWALGGYDKPLKVLMIFVVIDYLTGLAKAFKSKEVNSYIGFIGITKKICLFFIIILAHLVDSTLAMPEPILRTASILFYTSNEGISIVENMSTLGVPIPEVLKKRFIK